VGLPKTLKRLREARSLTPEDLAKAGGITVPSYYDLEAYADELDDAISVGSVACIARELGVSPSILYGGASGGTISTHDLASMARKHVDQSGQSLADCEEEVGYSLGEALADPAKFRDFNADGLRAVCAAVNVNWFDVLDHLLDDAPTTP
jgi:transcriptional regulator with XRE-family HTH domain